MSTADQHLDFQCDALWKYGVDEIVEDRASGAAANREKLNRLLDRLRRDDILVVWRLDRLGRTVKQLLELVEWFQEEGIHFVSLTESFDTTTATGRMCLNIFCAVAQMERELVAERTKKGLEVARARDRKGGRPPADQKAVETALKLYASGEYSVEEIRKMTGLSRTTLYSYVRREQAAVLATQTTLE